MLASFSRLGIGEITAGRAGRKTQSPPMPPETHETKPSRRKRRWIYPGNWRFWVLTLPALFWTALAILLFWPGLSFDWSAGKWFSFQRSHAQSGLDYAIFRCGPLGIEKQVFDIAPGAIKLGFDFNNTPAALGAGYGWDTGRIAIIFWKR